MQVPLTIADFLDRAETVFGDRVAVVDEPDPPGRRARALTYGELAGVARGLAAHLDAMGVGAGERVAIVSPERGAVPGRRSSASSAYGRVLVPVNFRLNAEEVSYIVEHSGATALLVDPELDDELAGVDVRRTASCSTPSATPSCSRRRRHHRAWHAATRTRPRRSTTRRARRRGPRACSSPTATAGSTR